MISNLKLFGIRSLVMLFQAICLSIIYFIPLYFFTKDFTIKTSLLINIIYFSWLISTIISEDNGYSVGIFWNTQNYIEKLVNYYNVIQEKQNIIKDYLKNTQF